MRRIQAVVFAICALILVTTPTALATTPAASPVSGTSRWWQQATCYEIFMRSFSDSDGDGIGDLAGLAEKLDYLNDGVPGSGNDLGVSCIWLMPIFPSPSYHGYDVTDYRAINPDYGTLDDMKTLLRESHARGIRVIIDLPVNHTSVDHPWFVDAATGESAQHRDWYIFEKDNPGYVGPWGEIVWHSTPGANNHYYGVFDPAMPDLNFRNPDVVKAIDDIAAFWISDIGVDGFRMDAVKHMIEDGEVQENTPETIAWITHFDDHVHALNPDAFTVGEAMGVSPTGLKAYYPNTLDIYFQFPLAGSIVSSASSASGTDVQSALAEAESTLPDQRWGTFTTNHDQERIASQVGDDPAKLRVAGMLLLTLPGTPFIYYGEEIGLPGTKPDEQIRTPMPWSADASAGFTKGTPWQPLQPGWETRNVAKQASDPASVLSTYRTFGALRETHPALQTGTYTPVATNDPTLMAFLRTSPGETVLVVINLGNSPSKPTSAKLAGVGDAKTTDLIGDRTGPRIIDGAVTVPSLPGSSGAVYLIGR